MSNQIQVVSFHNQKIIVLNHDEKPYIEMRSIVENIGLDWGAQLKRIKRNNILNSTMVIMTTVAKDGKNRELVCLPLGYLNGWLFGIDTNRVKPEIRLTLEQYQIECFDVLYRHFMPKVAQQYPSTISTAQQQQIKEAVLRLAQRRNESFQGVYRRFYNRFNIPKYQDLPASQFEEAMAFLGGFHVRNGLSDNDLYKLARLFVIAERMYSEIADITPALEKIFSKYADSFHSMAFHYTRELKEAKQIIQRETRYIKARGFLDDWNSVLPVIRNSH